jgi:hypothetical protein
MNAPIETKIPAARKATSRWISVSKVKANRNDSLEEESQGRNPLERRERSEPLQSSGESKSESSANGAQV